MVSFALRASSSSARAAALSLTSHVYTSSFHTCASLSSHSYSLSLSSSSLSLNTISHFSVSLSSLPPPPLSSHSSPVFFGNLRVFLPCPRSSPSLSPSSSNSHVVVSEQSVTELPPKLQNIVKGFQSVSDPRARYQQLLYYGSKLKPLPKDSCIPENKVVGCVSQVWLVPSLKEDGNVYFEADSDSALTKGLAALLVEGLSGSKPSEILKVTPDFVFLLGLKQSLTPSRNNGFLNMLKLMQKKTMELCVRSQSQAGEKEEERERNVNGESDVGGSVGSSNGTVSGNGNSGSDGQEGGEGEVEESTSERPVYNAIRKKLKEGLQAQVEVEDVSHQHAGHAGVHRGATETHFNVKVISDKFEGLNTVKRHRLVYGILKEEFSRGLHALSLVTKTPSETVGV